MVGIKKDREILIEIDITKKCLLQEGLSYLLLFFFILATHQLETRKIPIIFR